MGADFSRRGNAVFKLNHYHSERNDRTQDAMYILIRSAALSSLVALALLFCVHAQARNQDNTTAQISGVLKGANGASVILHLRSLDNNPVRYYDGYEVTTAKDGTFHFADLEAGAYQLETNGTGFTLPAPLPIALRPGEIRKGLTISVVPTPSLCGRVTDNGAPRNNTWAHAYRYNPEFDTLSDTFFPHTGVDGSFRFEDVTPGMYYVSGYTTFYPGSFIFNGAQPVAVTAQTPTTCSIEIPLQYTGCHATKVSGHIAFLTGDGDAKYKVQFFATNPAGGSMEAPIASNINDTYKPGDSFTATVCPGKYNIVLSDDQRIGPWEENHPTHKVVFDIQHLDVGATAIDGVALTPRPMASISGEVPGMSHNVGCPAGGPRAHVSILREGDGEFQTVDLDDNNQFKFRNVQPGDYTIAVGPIVRESFYLDSILVDGNPISGRKFTVAHTQPVNIVINISGDLTKALGHLSPDVRQEPRWEVAWTRPKGSVSGKVVGVSTEHGDLTLKLHSARYNSNASEEYLANATADGAFQFNSVDPGVYTLLAEGAGILSTEYGASEPGKRGTPIVVARGARVQDLTLSPPKLSSVCGKVTNSQGVPQAGIRISGGWNTNTDLYPRQVAARNGKKGRHVARDPHRDAVEVLTDADGRFRINGVSPGEYFPKSTLDVNRVVFFSPDGTLRTATPLIVPAGKDVGCGSSRPLDLTVPGDYKKLYAFSGKVEGDLPPAIGDRFWLQLLDVNASGTESYVGTATLDAAHHFSFDKVPGGTFLLQLHSAYGPEPMTWSGPYGPVSHLVASQTIDIHDGMPDVTLTPMQLPTVTGTVHFNHLPEQWNNNFEMDHQSITLVPREYRAPFSAILSKDGSFRIGVEDPGDYEVSFNLRGPLYIQSIRLDGREIKSRYLHIAATSSAKLEVEVSGNSGQVNARVIPDPSLPLAEPPVQETCSNTAWPQYQVVLFPDPLFPSPPTGQEPDSTSALPRLLRAERYGDAADPDLQVQAVPPGHYRALAVQTPGIASSPFGRRDAHGNFEQKLWIALAALGDPITVHPGDKLEISLPDRTIAVERIAAKQAVPLNSSLFVW